MAFLTGVQDRTGQDRKKERRGKERKGERKGKVKREKGKERGKGRGKENFSYFTSDLRQLAQPYEKIL